MVIFCAISVILLKDEILNFIMPIEGTEEPASTPLNGNAGHHVNVVFSDSQTSDVFLRHNDSNPHDDVVSDSEGYLRTRAYSESYSSDGEPRHYGRRPLTPQARKPPRKISFGRGPGKFSQRCINHNLYADLKRDPVEPDDDINTSLEHDDALDIKKEPDEPPTLSIRHLDRRKKILAVSLAMTNFAAMLSLSVMAPFFPQEASNVGVSNTVSGWIFGVFALVQFLTSPLFGSLLPRLGPWFLYQTGLFLAAGCTMLFGFMKFMPTDDGGFMFVFYCFLLRIFMALGCTAVATSAFTIIGHEFDDYASFMFGILETFSGIGLMVGPAIGGFLFALSDTWGFALPFIVIGGVMFLILILNAILLPDGIGATNFDVKSTPVTKLLRIPSIFLVCLSLVMSASVWAILDPILEPHLREFNLGSEILGLIFLLMAASYAISSPLWGWLSEKTPDSKIVILLGFFGSGFAMLLLAPSPLLGFAENENIIWLNIVALLLLGITVSMAIIPTFESVLDSAELAGLEDNMGTYATVAGMWGSFYALGDFIGPVLGGMLQDEIGFQWSTTYMGIACLVTGFILLVLFLYELKFGRIGALKADVNEKGENCLTENERKPLLGTSLNTVDV